MLPTDNWRGNNDVLDSLAATTAFNLGKPERPFGVFDLDFIESSKELFDFFKKKVEFRCKQDTFSRHQVQEDSRKSNFFSSKIRQC